MPEFIWSIRPVIHLRAELLVKEAFMLGCRGGTELVRPLPLVAMLPWG